MSEDEKTPRSRESMIALLAEQHRFPGPYKFKFIGSAENISKIEVLLPAQAQLTRRPSSKGNFLSLTAVVMVANPEEVLAVYEKAQAIDGLMAF